MARRKLKRLVDRFLDQGATGRLLHHGGRDIAGGDDAVLRRRRGVHHERIVEPSHVQPPVIGVLDVDHRCLRQCGEELCVDWVANVMSFRARGLLDRMA